jgi:probable HAF family extracellular repeat protein
MQDLGTLPGGSSSFATGINTLGQIVGWSNTVLAPGAPPHRGFLWQAATGMQDLGVLPSGDSAEAYGINNQGQVVGLGWAQVGGAPVVRAVLWQPAGTSPSPTTTAGLAPPPNAAGWNRTDVTVMLTATAGTGGPPVQSVTYSASGAQTIPRTTVPASTATVPITAEGVTTLSYFATDQAGTQEQPKTLTIRIDKTPPTVICQASPSTLWPPNGKLVPVQVNVSVTDPNGSGPNGFTLAGITSNEGSITTEQQGFVVGAASTSGSLQASRAGNGSGRVYTLTYQGSDVAGNTATCTATVTVPHDQGH